jgi:hypothetical protein
MKLNHNSISARLYRWFYMTQDMPQTLCPYFWKLVVMWVFIAPVGLISLPLVMAKEKADDWQLRLLGGIVLWGIVFVAFLAIFPVTYLFWGWFNPNTTFRIWQGIGILIWMITITSSIVFIILHIYKKSRDKKRRNQQEYIWDHNGDYVLNPDYVPYEEKPNIIIEFIKAKYNKYCPKIDWKNE